MSSDRHRREKESSPTEDRLAANHYSTRTNSKDPTLINSRVFIGNLPTDKMDRKILLSIFEKYGNVIGVSLLTGYGFVQFENEDDAREAVENERGTILKSSRIDVKMAAEGKKQQQEQNQKRALSSARGGGGRGQPPDRRDRSRSPLYDRRPPMDDRRGPLDGPRRMPPSHDPYSRRDPFDRDRELDRFEPPPFFPLPPIAPLPPAVPSDNIFRPPYECEIILTSPTLRSYADSIEKDLKPHGMVVQHNVVKSESEVPNAVEDLTRLKVPYAIIVSQKNEAHRSITLNILHGTPQEHRNMPLDDALKLIVRTFEAYVQQVRNKATAPPARPEFLIADEHTSYLLNLLADNRHVNIEELNRVIGYLEKRRVLLLDKMANSAAPGPADRLGLTDRPPLGADRPPIDDRTGMAERVAMAERAALADRVAFTDRGGGLGLSSGNSSLFSNASPAVTSTASINFNNPSVQKALDDLMHTSGPGGILPSAGAYGTSYRSTF